MDLEVLEEELEALLGSDFEIQTDKYGQVVIFTGLKIDEDGELIALSDDEDEDAEFDEDFESYDEDEDEDD